MNTSFDSAASLEAADILSGAQAELEAFLGRPITLRTFEDVVIDVPPHPYNETAWRRGNLTFPHSPVVELVSLKADGAVVDLTGVRIAGWGIRDYAGNVGADGSVVATYRAGLDGKNDPEYMHLRTLVKRRAAREMIPRTDQTQGKKSTSDEGFSSEDVAPDGGYTPAELNSVRRHKRRRIGR